MKALLKPAIVAGLMLATVAAPAMAASDTSAQAVKGIGVVDIGTVVAGSNAYKVAEQQRPVTYKQQIDAANARAQQINTQLDPLLKKFNTDRSAASPNEASLKQQADAIDKLYQQGQREVDILMGPVTLSKSYVAEQIGDKLGQAIENAAKKRNISLVMRPDQLLYSDDSYDLNQAVIAELDTLIPLAQLTPPPNWLPRRIREQQAEQQAMAQQGVSADPQAAAAAAVAPVAQQPGVEAGPQPEGR